MILQVFTLNIFHCDEVFLLLLPYIIHSAYVLINKDSTRRKRARGSFDDL